MSKITLADVNRRNELAKYQRQVKKFQDLIKKNYPGISKVSLDLVTRAMSGELGKGE